MSADEHNNRVPPLSEDRENEMLNQLEHMYKDDRVRGYVLSRIKAKGCAHQEALDLFQDAMILIVTKYRSGELDKIHSAPSYVYRVVYNMWLNRYRKKKEASLDDVTIDPADEDKIEQMYDRQGKRDLLDSVLAVMSAKCRELLRAQRMGYTTEEIAELMQFVNSDRVRKERYRCLVKIRTKLMDSKHIRELAAELNYLY